MITLCIKYKTMFLSVLPYSIREKYSILEYRNSGNERFLYSVMKFEDRNRLKVYLDLLGLRLGSLSKTVFCNGLGGYREYKLISK